MVAQTELGAWVPDAGLVLLLACAACRSKRPDYSRPLPAGADALRKIEDEGRWPDVKAAYAERDASLLEAVERSMPWVRAPSTQAWFPNCGISHAHAEASGTTLLTVTHDHELLERFERVVDFQELLKTPA